MHTTNSKLYFLKKLHVFSYCLFDALATVSGLFSNTSQPNAPKTITSFPPVIVTYNILDILFTWRLYKSSLEIFALIFPSAKFIVLLGIKLRLGVAYVTTYILYHSSSFNKVEVAVSDLKSITSGVYTQSSLRRGFCTALCNE